MIRWILTSIIPAGVGFTICRIIKTTELNFHMWQTYGIIICVLLMYLIGVWTTYEKS